MNELKLVVGDEAVNPEGHDLTKVNPIDALNRRDIELIKRSLTNMQKDCAELRGTIVTLHARQSKAPSKGFFLGLGLLALVVVGSLAIARPQLDAALRDVPLFAKLTGSDVSR